MHRLLVFFLIVFAQISGFSQKPPLIFHNLSIHDGLSENSVNTIIEDKTGYMWFGTHDGLNRYDGYKFSVFNSNPKDSFSVTNRNIKLLFIDSKNNLWIATTNGVNLFDPSLEIFYNFKNNKYPALKYLFQDIVGITEDSKHRIWVATISDGIYCINSLYEEPKKYKSKFDGESNVYNCLTVESDSSLWIGTKDGLIAFNIFNEDFSDLRSPFGDGYEVRKIFVDEYANKWICSNEGLIKISKKGVTEKYFHDSNSSVSLYENGIVDIIPYDHHSFLIGTNSNSIDYFDTKTEKFYHYINELSSNNINSLYKDTKGDFWVGTYLNGLNYSNSTTNLFFHSKNNPYSDNVIKKGIVTRFLKDSKGDLWITTDGGGLFLKKKDSDKYINFTEGKNGLTSNVLISVYEDPDGEIWITSYGAGLFRYNAKTNSFINYRNDRSDPNSLFNDFTKDVCYYDGKLWISGYDLGIGIFDKKTGKFTNIRQQEANKKEGLPSNWIQVFYIDKKGDFWLATFNGLAKYQPKTNTFKNYYFQTVAKSLDTDINSILEILEDSRGNFWLGTMGNGLLKFDRNNGSYKVFTTENGLSDNLINSIVEDNYNNLWIGTNDGVTKFNILTLKAKPYTIKDGVPYCSYHYNSRYKDDNGQIYLGANNGIVVINPRMTCENLFLPPVVLTDFKIFNQSVGPLDENSPLKETVNNCKEIVLSYDQNSITFEFAALNFNSPKNNQFAYYLEGFDKSWFYVGNQRTATYTNLNPGTYIFKVQAANNDGKWNIKGAMVTVIINPPYWKTWWFIMIAISSLILFLYLIYYWRTSMIRKENAMLDEMVKERTCQLNEANQQLETFVYKASHDIKGPLKSIIGLTAIGKKDVSEGGNPIPYFDHILKSTSKLDALVLDLLTVTKVKQSSINTEKINFRELINEILISFQNFPGYDRMKFDIDIKDGSEFYSDKQILGSILQNLIENGIKYSDSLKPVSFLKINITVSDKGAYLVFKDNGLGIPETDKKKIFDMFFKSNNNSNGTGLGLYIVKTSVEKLNGFIELDSELGVGSTFYVKL